MSKPTDRHTEWLEEERVRLLRENAETDAIALRCAKAEDEAARYKALAEGLAAALREQMKEYLPHAPKYRATREASAAALAAYDSARGSGDGKGGGR